MTLIQELNKEAAKVVYPPPLDGRGRMAQELGRRVSRGEYERRTTKYETLPDPYAGMVVLTPDCPRAVRQGQKDKIVPYTAPHGV